jgi:hypothetical protein
MRILENSQTSDIFTLLYLTALLSLEELAVYLYCIRMNDLKDRPILRFVSIIVVAATVFAVPILQMISSISHFPGEVGKDVAVFFVAVESVSCVAMLLYFQRKLQ